MVDAVVVQHPDRLGRSYALGAAITLLANRGVEVHACNRGLISNEDDENAQIQNDADVFISSIERRNLQRRLRRGLVEKVTVKKKMPGYGGAATFGYKWEGARRERKLVIFNDEAQYVVFIFEWYDSGVPTVEICRRLHDLRVPTPAEFKTSNVKNDDRYRWITPQIYRILKDPIYIGTFIAFNRTKKTVKKKLHDEPVSVSVPAIISLDLFERVQERLAQGRRFSRRNTKTNYLLHCRIRCSCGSAIVGSSDGRYRYYKCGATIRKHDRLKPCNIKQFNALNVEYTVWKWIEEHVLDEENLKQGIARKQAGVAGERRKLGEEREYYTQKLEENAHETTRLMQLYTARIFTLQEIAAEKKRLDEARANLERTRLELDAKIAGLGISNDVAEDLLATVRVIKAKATNLTDEGQRKIIDMCDTAVTLYYKDGKPHAHIDVSLTVQSDDIPIVSRVV
jgi:site-specific DNA recombinase